MSSTALSKAEQNALVVSYDVLGTRVDLDLQFVKRYLVRGNPEKITDQEIVFFMNTCKMQKLNPLVSGEVYCIKFGNEPAQMVVGKGAYLRRAFEHPEYLYKEEGIIVQRGNEIMHKEGCCIYPGENLIGGWCRVFFMRNGKERKAYKEVALSEYDKGQANWKTKPATMIVKVATSQCVREAFPKDYEGIYSEEEMVASGAIPTIDGNIDDLPTEEDPSVTKEQRQALFKMAQQYFGDQANDVLKAVLNEFGRETTTDMSMSIYNKVLGRLMEIVEDSRVAGADEGDSTPD